MLPMVLGAFYVARVRFEKYLRQNHPDLAEGRFDPNRNRYLVISSMPDSKLKCRYWQYGAELLIGGGVAFSLAASLGGYLVSKCL